MKKKKDFFLKNGKNTKANKKKRIHTQHEGTTT